MSRLDGARSTISMWHEGDYSTHTQGAKDAIDNARDLACATIAEMDVGGTGEPFHIADYGAADGGTSMDFHRATISVLRARAPRRAVCITYTDLPRNDYSALFTTANGGRSRRDQLSRRERRHLRLRRRDELLRADLSPETVDFGFSATAMHWLSALPCPVSDHIHMVGAQGEELEALRARALTDWRDILLARASELKPGGRLMTLNLALADDGRHMGNTGGANMFDVMNRLWRALAGDETITDAEYRGPPFRSSTGPRPSSMRRSSIPTAGSSGRTASRACADAVHALPVRCSLRRGRRRQAFRRDLRPQHGAPGARRSSSTPSTRRAPRAAPGDRRSLLRKLRRPRPLGPRTPRDGLYPRMHGDGEGPARGRLNRVGGPSCPTSQLSDVV